jgi:hypothetical protein
VKYGASARSKYRSSCLDGGVERQQPTNYDVAPSGLAGSIAQCGWQSGRSEIVANDHATLHHEHDALRFCYIRERIAVTAIGSPNLPFSMLPTRCSTPTPLTSSDIRQEYRSG